MNYLFSSKCKSLRACLLVGAITLGLGSAAPAGDIERSTIDIDIDGASYQLDSLIGTPSEGTGPWPIALISHGAPGRSGPRSITSDLLSGWVRSLTARGYLTAAVMRRGYGTSEGDAYRGNDTCDTPDPTSYIYHHAADLDAALTTLSQRPDADPTQIIAMGHSAGALAVLAMKTPHLRFNISGGMYRWEDGAPAAHFDVFRGCEKYPTALLASLAQIAAETPAPTHWFYAQNDPFFSPDFAAEMQNVWQAGGGTADLTILPEYPPNGHKMFIQSDGQAALLPAIDETLRAATFPTWDDHLFDPLRAQLGPRQNRRLDSFLTQYVSHKAFAIPLDGADHSYWASDYYALDAARHEVRTRCEQASNGPCAVIVEDFRPTAAADKLRSAGKSSP